jgi:hypothetical protein
MTATTASPGRFTQLPFDRRISPRTAVLVLATLACVLYAIWQRTVPPGPIATDVDADTMCLIYRIGLGGLCR